MCKNLNKFLLYYKFVNLKNIFYYINYFLYYLFLSMKYYISKFSKIKLIKMYY